MAKFEWMKDELSASIVISQTRLNVKVFFNTGIDLFVYLSICFILCNLEVLNLD